MSAQAQGGSRTPSQIPPLTTPQDPACSLSHSVQMTQHLAEGPGLHPAVGARGPKDKRTETRPRRGGNNLAVEMEKEEEGNSHKEEQGPRAGSAWHPQRGAEQKRREEQLPTSSLAGQGLQEF